ncbi:MAG: 6-carboxytetrahydropterin synthase [Chlamydiota bacterium]|nr:6-carboxytetrahydropterin synthase [Chlamydiota bacterium]
MYRVTKILHFSYAHRLLNYTGKCKFLHGHNGRLEIDLTSHTLDAHGMVIDFDEIKKRIGQWIENDLDHKTFLCKDDSLATLLVKAGEQVLMMEGSPTAENMAKFIFDYITQCGFPATEVRLWETESSYASYSNIR